MESIDLVPHFLHLDDCPGRGAYGHSKDAFYAPQKKRVTSSLTFDVEGDKETRTEKRVACHVMDIKRDRWQDALVMVPQELVDYIIDHLYHDTQTLRNCSLVCRAWLPSSRLHLFNKVRLNIPRSTSHRPSLRLYHLLTSSPEVIHHIHDLQLCSGSPAYNVVVEEDEEYHPSWVFSEPSLPPLLNLLTHLRKFDFASDTSLEWDVLPSSLRDAICNVLRLPSLVYMRLQSWEFPDIKGFEKLLRGCANLKALALWSIKLGEENEEDRISGPGTGVGAGVGVGVGVGFHVQGQGHGIGIGQVDSQNQNDMPPDSDSDIDSGSDTDWDSEGGYESDTESMNPNAESPIHTPSSSPATSDPISAPGPGPSSRPLKLESLIMDYVDCTYFGNWLLSQRPSSTAEDHQDVENAENTRPEDTRDSPCPTPAQEYKLVVDLSALKHVRIAHSNDKSIQRLLNALGASLERFHLKPGPLGVQPLSLSNNPRLHTIHLTLEESPTALTWAATLLSSLPSSILASEYERECEPEGLDFDFDNNSLYEWSSSYSFGSGGGFGFGGSGGFDGGFGWGYGSPSGVGVCSGCGCGYYSCLCSSSYNSNTGIHLHHQPSTASFAPSSLPLRPMPSNSSLHSLRNHSVYNFHHAVPSQVSLHPMPSHASLHSLHTRPSHTSLHTSLRPMPSHSSLRSIHSFRRQLLQPEPETISPLLSLTIDLFIDPKKLPTSGWRSLAGVLHSTRFRGVKSVGIGLFANRGSGEWGRVKEILGSGFESFDGDVGLGVGVGEDVMEPGTSMGVTASVRDTVVGSEPILEPQTQTQTQIASTSTSLMALALGLAEETRRDASASDVNMNPSAGMGTSARAIPIGNGNGGTRVQSRTSTTTRTKTRKDVLRIYQLGTKRQREREGSGEGVGVGVGVSMGIGVGVVGGVGDH
ncbi:hypothetical protein D9758_011487 [Tetrapyrgos nigripes]|uniref:F-box domain-containing protein n=1 Tax=Tetrapyrgos nigripes TaxID=182062 RepID=A0A8H5CSL8_9AGAR|nr:hypothetical protein D9758_011487 [Tetrapyrgos nigripes]